MTRLLTALYGAACYGFFLLTFLYAIGFTTNAVVPRTVDHGGPLEPATLAALIDVGLLGLFALQHSVMARRGFKRWWTKLVPAPVERSTYVLFATLALAALCWHWRPLPTEIWHIGDPTLRLVVHGLAALGWLTVLGSTFLISHFELFGLRQVFAKALGRDEPTPRLRTPGLYKLVRHPIYVGFLIAFWSAPDMTVGHLLFSVATTGYILIGILLEERDLVATFGEAYRRYRREVWMLLPLPKLRAKARERRVA
jgi:protein-S-isoprenylcysteine O-methyltransferase Ste14